VERTIVESSSSVAFDTGRASARSIAKGVAVSTGAEAFDLLWEAGVVASAGAARFLDALFEAFSTCLASLSSLNISCNGCGPPLDILSGLYQY
jgi:hypothetical protein